jgi:hypothetical protein
MNLEKDIESVGLEILNLFGTPAFTACLTSITAEKGDDSTLENFASRKYGWADMEAELPALYVMELREELIRDDGKGRWMLFKFAIEVYDTGADVQTLEKKLNRYARAISETLLANYSDNGTIQVVEYSPVFKNQDNLYKVCSIQFNLKVFQDIT